MKPEEGRDQAGAAGKMINLTGESPVLSVVHRVGSYIQLMGRKRLMGKPGSKSLSRKGKQSEGPEHKAKTVTPKTLSLVFADPVRPQGKAVGFQEEMDMCTETKPGVGVQAPQKRLVSKSQEGLVPLRNLAISLKKRNAGEGMRLTDEVVRAMKTGNAVRAKDLWGDGHYQKQPPFTEAVKAGNTLIVAWLSANLQREGRERNVILKPDWGNPEVRNFREDFGDIGFLGNAMRQDPTRPTQVKVLSAEKPNNPEADTLHVRGRQKFSDRQGKSGKILAVSETVAWDQEDRLGIWETQSVIRKSGLRSNKP